MILKLFIRMNSYTYYTVEKCYRRPCISIFQHYNSRGFKIWKWLIIQKKPFWMEKGWTNKRWKIKENLYVTKKFPSVALYDIVICNVFYCIADILLHSVRTLKGTIFFKTPDCFHSMHNLAVGSLHQRRIMNSPLPLFEYKNILSSYRLQFNTNFI